MAMKDITDLQVVQAQQRWHDNRQGPWAYEILEAETGQPEKVCYKCMERAADRDLLEYGVSLRTAWLTDKGKALLAGEDITTGFDYLGNRIHSANAELTHPESNP
jgi:hypothetical protein